MSNEFMTKSEVQALAVDAAAIELQKRIKPGFEDIDPKEYKAVIEDSKKTAEYVNGLKNDIAELKKSFGDVAGSIKAVQELQSEARAQNGKASKEDAEIFKSVLEVSAPQSLISGEKKSRAADVLKAAYNNITTNSEGGYLVPTGVGRQMLSIALATSVAMQDAGIEPMALGQKQLNVPLDLEGGSVSYPGEATAANAGECVFGIASIAPKRRIAKLIATRELLDMSAVDVMSHIANRLGILFAKDTDTQAFAGTGTPMTGLRGASTLIPKNLSASTFAPTAAEMIGGYGLLDDVDDSNMKWYLTRSTYWNSIGGIQDTTSGNRVIGMSDVLSLTQRMLLGSPVRFCHSAAMYPYSSSAGSLVFAILADLSKALRLSNFGVTRMSVSEEASVLDSAGSAVNLWDQGMFAVKMEGYFAGICPDFYTTLTKAPGVAFTSNA